MKATSRSGFLSDIASLNFLGYPGYPGYPGTTGYPTTSSTLSLQPNAQLQTQIAQLIATANEAEGRAMAQHELYLREQAALQKAYEDFLSFLRTARPALIQITNSSLLNQYYPEIVTAARSLITQVDRYL